MTLSNPVRDRLARGELALGMGLRLARSAEFAPAMKTAGFDWLFIDLEHGALSLETASQVCLAALAAQIAPIVRVGHDALSEGTRLLDNGALGVVVPHVDTAQQARRLVERFRYPPLGRRSVTMTLPFFGYGPVTAGEITTQLDAATLVIAMIETAEAVANADAIAAVPGIDILLVGTQDLGIDLGLRETDHPSIRDAYEKVVSACRQHGKWAGMAGVTGEEMTAHGLGLGIRFVLAAMDLPLLVAAAAQRGTQLRQLCASAGN